MTLNKYAEQYPKGYVSRYMEVGLGTNRTISSGRGDHGGKSYGIYQLSSNTGTLNACLNFIKTRFPGVLSGNASTVGTPTDSAVLALRGDALDTWWRDVAPYLESFCTEYIIETHTKPLMGRIGEYIVSREGADAYSRNLKLSEAWFELVHSTAIQYGPSTNILHRAYDAVRSRYSPSMWVWHMAHYKADTVGAYFKSSSAQVRRSVENRHRFEAVWLNAIAHGTTGAGESMLYDMIGGNEPIGSTELNKLWELMAHRYVANPDGTFMGDPIQEFERLYHDKLKVGHTRGKIDSTIKATIIELTRSRPLIATK